MLQSPEAALDDSSQERGRPGHPDVFFLRTDRAGARRTVVGSTAVAAAGLVGLSAATGPVSGVAEKTSK